MLVLTRKKGEEIVVGDNEIVISVIEIRGDRVRLGIAAPREVSVHRREVYEQVKAARLRGGHGESGESKGN